MEPADRQTLDRLLQEIDTMRVHRDADGRPSLKKPLLLLLVLSRLAASKLSQNRLHFTDIEEELRGLIKRFGLRGGKRAVSPEEPFVYLGTATFWNVHYSEGIENNRRSKRSKRVLRDPATYVTLDDAVYELLARSADARAEAVTRVLGRWWSDGEDGDLRGVMGF